MKQLLLVFLGGGAGSVLRFFIAGKLNPIWSFPLGTFLVNMAGSFLIGLILGLGLKQQIFSPNTTLLLATGFCGGFTTFSAFSYENQELLKAGDFLNFGFYTAGSIFVGIAAVILGIYVSRIIQAF